MKKLKLKKEQYDRFSILCKIFGFQIENDIYWELTSWLSEIPNYYYRVIKNGITVAIVDLDEN